MRHRILQLCKEPLLHFLVVGAMLFFFTRDADSELEVEPPRRIVVDDKALENFLRFRTQPRFTESSDHPAERLSPEGLKIAVDALVRDEALYREAKALGLDQADYGVRQRLIAQLEFINEEVVASGIKLTEEQLKEQLAHNADRYRVPETITFTHVFFDNQRRGQTGAKNQAEIKLAELNAADGAVPFHEAPMHGDRFLYRQNYAKQDETLIASHFGAEAQRKLFSLEVNDAKWQGPIESDYGVHLILLTNRNDSFVAQRVQPPPVGTVIRMTFAGQQTQTVVLTPGETAWQVPYPAARLSVARDYFQLGLHHIWAGMDHLLFVVCLICIAGTWRRTFATITGFTIAHSITLALSSLGIARLSVPPIEALIALSVVFLAMEVAKGYRESLTWKHPILISSGFGLLHGLGFAAALNQIGLPQSDLVTGLLFFNLGAEVGQIAFAVPVLAIVSWLGSCDGAANERCSDKIAADEHLARVHRPVRVEQRILGYCVGIVATFWLFGRVSNCL